MKYLINKAILSLAALATITTNQLSFSMNILATENILTEIIIEDIDTLTKIINRKNFDINKPTKSGLNEGETPIFTACRLKKTNIVNLFLRKGAIINKSLESGRFKGLTPFFIACELGCKEIIQLLIKNGVDFNQHIQSGNFTGYTPFFIACELGRTEIVEILLDLFIEKNIQFNDPIKYGDNEGHTPFYIACKKGRSEIAKLLIKNGIDINQPIKSGTFFTGDTPLRRTIRDNRIEIVKLLLQNCAIIDEKIVNLAQEKPEIKKYIDLTIEFNKTVKENGNIIKLISSKTKDKEAYQFLVKLTFGYSINELRNRKRIDKTPFYGVYEKLKKIKFLNKIFLTPDTFDTSENKSIYDFIKSAMEIDCFGPISKTMKNSLEKQAIIKNMCNQKQNKFFDCKINLKNSN